jgi:hypothetical protein
MKKVLWISRHYPTKTQIDEMSQNDHLVLTDIELGSMNLNSEEDLDAYWEEFNKNIKEIKPEAIYGVFPTPILNTLVMNMGNEYVPVECWIPIYSAWNVQRSVEGERPTFEHYKFMQVGVALNPHTV